MLTLALAAWWWWAAPWLMRVAVGKIPSSRAGESRRTAPDFSLRDATGRAVSLSDYRGRVVLLNFWATWCPPCKIEIPWFVQFQNEYQASGLTVLGVSMDEDGWKAVRPFLAARNINYPILLGNEEVGRLYGGIDSLPTTLLIGRDGRTEFYHAGLIPRAEYRTEIAQLLAQKKLARKKLARKKDDTRIHHAVAVRTFGFASIASLNCLSSVSKSAEACFHIFRAE